MRRLQEGDVVLIRVRVDRIDPKDDFTPYCDVDLEGSITRFGDHQIVEVLEGARQPHEPAADPERPLRAGRRMTVGDKVLHKRRSWLGVGEIVSDDHTNLPYHVRWGETGSTTAWVKERDLIRVPLFEVGDRVAHEFKPEWGLGVILDVKDLEPFHYRMFDYFGGEDPELRECSRSYKVRFDRVGMSPAGPTDVWYVAEENLSRRFE